MKKTQWIALFQDIKTTFVSFLSITLFVALGIAIFLGIKWNEPAVANAANAYFDERGFHDFALVFPYGFTPDDVKSVQELDSVSEAEGSYSTHGTVWVGGERYVLVIQSLTQRVDKTVALEGELPSASDEIGVERLFAQATGLKIGDTLSIEAGSGDSSPLNSARFKITAIVEHPAYIREETAYSRGLSSIGDGAVDFYVLTPQSAFNPEAFDNCFAQILVRGEGLEGLNTFGEQYKARADEIAEQIGVLGVQRAPLRADELLSRYRSEIAGAEKTLAEAEKELEDGKREFADGEEQILNGERQIESGAQQIALNERKLAEAERAYAAGQAAYDSGSAELASARSKLQKALADAGYSTDPAKAKDEIKDDLALFRAAQAELNKANQLIDDYINASPDDDERRALAELLHKVTRVGIMLSDTKLDELWGDIDTYAPPFSDAEKQTLLALIDKCKASPDELTAAEIETLLNAMKKMGVVRNYLDVTKITDRVDKGIADLNTLLGHVNDYISGENRLEQGRQELASAAAQIESGRQELQSARWRLSAARRQLEASKQQLADAKKTLADGDSELAEKKAELDKAKADLAAFSDYDSWTLQSRSDNPSCETARTSAEMSRKLCYTMALLFVFVGLMVCYTAITRNVREAQKLTGVQKALGFRKREIIAHYMTYSMLAVALGALLGFVLGYFVIESIINSTYESLFVFESIKNVFILKDLLIITAVEAGLICLATWLPCRGLLKRPAVDLLRGDDHGNGRTRFYEKTKWWKHCSLYTQTTINNLANDSARVIASLVGVAGCTALIVMAMQLQLSLLNTPEEHFANVWRYDMRLVCDDRVEGAQAALGDALSTKPVSYTPVLQEAIFIEDAEGGLYKADLIVPEEPDKLDNYIHLNDAASKRRLSVPAEGVLVSETYTKYHSSKVGDTIGLLDMSGARHECVIAGITEHYLSTNQLVMSPAYYERVMSEPAASNTYYINYNSADPAALKSTLEKVDGYFSATDEYAKWTSIFASAFKIASLVVYICLFLAAMMAMLVLLNLNVVFISEKAKELIIMRINGFSISATKKYIYRDNIVLTALGILLGVGAGLALAVWILGILQRQGDNFYTAPNLWACLTGVGISAVLSLITNIIALRRVDKLKVSDIGRM